MDMTKVSVWLATGVVAAVVGCGGGSTPSTGTEQAKAGAEAPPAAAPAAKPAAATGEVVARYGQKSLSSEQVTAEFARLPERSRKMMTDDGRKRFIENFILTDLLYDNGASQGFDKDPEIARQVEDLRRRLVVQRVVRGLQNVPAVTDEEVKKYYDENGEMYSTTTIKARHILVKEEAKAAELLAKVKADPAKFSEIAKENSTDTASASKGGDLGFFGHGRMVPEFEKAAFALKSPGDISEVVKTPYGFHIIVLDERKEGAPKAFDQVKEQIRATLRNQALQARTQGFYDDLKQKANIQIDEALLGKVVAAVPVAPEGAAGAGSMGGMGGMPPGHPPMGSHGGH